MLSLRQGNGRQLGDSCLAVEQQRRLGGSRLLCPSFDSGSEARSMQSLQLRNGNVEDDRIHDTLALKLGP